MKVGKAEIVLLKSLYLCLEGILLLFGEPKVPNLKQVAIIVNEDVCGLNISVNESFLVDMLEPTD